jgi:hypothetical protein
MKHASNRSRSRAGLFAAGLALSLLSLTAAQAAPHRVVLPAGSVIPVRLDQSLSSKTARTGERFTATVRYGRDDAGLPEGSRVEGVVREALRSEEGKPGVLDLDFRRMVMPGGETRTLTGSLIALDAKSVKSTESGRLVATSDKSKDRLKFIGIGAGAGLLIGALTKGNTLTDMLLGAGAGYLYNEFKKEKPGDVNLKSGTEFGIRLDREFAFDTNRTDYYRGAAYERTDRNEEGDRYYRRDENRDNRDYDRESSDDIGMLIDDRNVVFGGTKPYVRGSVVYLPLDTVARAAGFAYTYDPERRMIYARGRALRLSLRSRIAVLNGERYSLPSTPEMRSGKLYVPMQFIGLVTGGSISWDADSRTVVLDRDRER